MRSRTPQLPTMLVATIGTALAGCNAESGILRSAGGPEREIRIWVRDRSTQQPIEGAAVSAETTSRDHPFSAASILGQTGAESSHARTDEHGAATVAVLAEREFRVVVWTPGRSPVVFGPALLGGRAGAWIDTEWPGEASGSGVQVRIQVSPETGR